MPLPFSVGPWKSIVGGIQRVAVPHAKPTISSRFPGATILDRHVKPGFTEEEDLPCGAQRRGPAFMSAIFNGPRRLDSRATSPISAGIRSPRRSHANRQSARPVGQLP